MIRHTKAEGWNYFRNYNVRVVEKMIPVEIRGYVMGDEYRWNIKWLGWISAILCCLMSVGVLYAQIKAQEGLWLCLAPSALLMGIALYVPFTKQKYSKILKMTYRCDGDSAENRCFGETHALDVTSPFFAYELTVSFTAAKGATWYEHFYVLSDQPFTQVSGIGECGVDITRIAWKRGYILLPHNDDTQAWLSALTGATQIPPYPKVACLQARTLLRNTFNEEC